jgi:hypothetical protein
MRTASRYAWITIGILFGVAMAILFGVAMAILLLLSDDANALFETRDARLQSVKTVGIVSAIGDQFTFVKARLTGLGNGPRSVPIAAWGLDELIVQEVSTALSDRFQVTPVTYKRASFATVQEAAITAVNLVRGDPFKKLVETEVSPQGLDAYIVITKARAYFGGGNRRVDGVGLITYSTVLEAYSQIHALYEIRVVDGKRFDVIEKFAAGPLDNASNVRLPGPSRLVDASFDVGDENLHRVIVDLVTRSLPITLADMHLVNRKP